jgi:hypothetical protein
MHLWLPKLMGIPGTSPITLDTRSLAPRPWPWRLARWTPAPEQDQPVVLLGNLPLGRRSLWLQITGAAFYLVLLGLGLLGLFALWERNQRLWERIREEERFAHPGEESGPPAAA